MLNRVFGTLAESGGVGKIRLPQRIGDCPLPAYASFVNRIR
jgi:hypothetical protein